jgi:hypothetical protein
MGIFGKPKSSAIGTEAAGFEFGERKVLDGPLPIVDSLVDTVQWLENARNRVAKGGASCCLVVCAPNPIEGAAMELTVGEIASRFAHSLRSYDAIFRYGRDKLLIALPHVKESDAAAVLQRLYAIVARLPFKMPNQSLDMSVTVSLGGVMMDSSAVQERQPHLHVDVRPSLTCAAAGPPPRNALLPGGRCSRSATARLVREPARQRATMDRSEAFTGYGRCRSRSPAGGGTVPPNGRR